MPATNNITAKKQSWVCSAILLALGVVTLWLYWPVRAHDFIALDDVEYVSGNPHVKAGVTSDGVRWAFTQSHAGNWHPLTWISHMLDCQLFGVDAGPHHLVNAGFHVANSLLLFLALQSLTAARWRSAFVAALFALHPLHVESVAWVSERKDVLSTFFFLLTLLAYAGYVRRIKVQNPKSKMFLGLTLALFSLGLLAKPMLVTLPFVLLLLDCWPLGRLQFHSLRSQTTALRNLVFEKIPFFALSTASCALTIWAQQRGLAIVSIESLPLSIRITNSLATLLRYVEKMLWPTKLAIFYPLQQHEAPVAKALVATLFLVAVSALVVALFKRRPYLLIGWLWYLGTLVPVIGLVQVGSQAMADRYTYIPLIGLFIMLAWMAADITRKWKHKAFWLGVLAAAILVACAGQTARQIRYWKSSRTLFAHAAEVTERNYMALTFLGAEFSKEDNHEEAIKCFESAVQAAPKKPRAWLGLAHELDAIGKREEAERSHQTALGLEPDNAGVHNTYAISLAEQGKFDAAEKELRRSLELDPNSVDALLNLVVVLRKQSKLDEAIAECQRAIKLDPGSDKPRAYYADTLFQLGRVEEAIPLYRDAVRLNPKSADARIGLGLALVEAKDFAGASAEFSSLLAANPQDARALDGLGYVLALQGKLGKAQAKFREAQRLNPKYAYAHIHLAMCLSARKQTSDAMAEYRKALELDDRNPLALNNLAWLLATDPDVGNRNGAEAVTLAERACKLTNNEQPFFLGTLAAAYAEAGQFDKAVATAEKARDVARAKGLTDVVARNEELLELYRAGHPYRETDGSSPKGTDAGRAGGHTP